jgi:hypothetical protein
MSNVAGLAETLSLADWDACDEHETTFPKGDPCPACIADMDDSPLKDSDLEADLW